MTTAIKQLAKIDVQGGVTFLDTNYKNSTSGFV